MVNCEQSSNLFWAPGSSSRSTASPFRFVILAPSRLTTTATTPSLSVSRGCNANCSGGRILSAYYARFTQDNAHYLSVSGNERRDSFDVRRVRPEVLGMTTLGRGPSARSQVIRSPIFGGLQGLGFSLTTGRSSRLSCTAAELVSPPSIADTMAFGRLGPRLSIGCPRAGNEREPRVRKVIDSAASCGPSDYEFGGQEFESLRARH